jgi:energy-coupling factor transport system substrate-specific component
VNASEQGGPRDGGAREPWTLRDFVVLGAIGLVFGFLFLQWVPIWLAARATGPIAQEMLFGFWFVGGILGGYIVRKPGAAILGEVATAFFQVFLFGSPAGVLLLVTGLMQGLGPELVYGLSGYRRWSLPVVVMAGVAAAVVALPWNWYRLNYFALDPALLAIMAASRIVSGILFGGWVSWLVARALLRAGVLQNFAAGRAQSS